MHEEDISKMNFKELRAEVQLLRDELAVFKRKYEDIIYNIGSDNLSTTYKVSQENKFSSIEQKADKIKSTVTELNENISELEQTADSITSTVTKIYGEAIYAESKSDFEDIDAMYCLNGKYYYYNDITEKWTGINSKSVVSQIKQTADGTFVLGNVRVSGDLISGGAIKGVIVGTHEDAFGDGIWLNSETNRLEVYYSGACVGSWSVADFGSSIYPAKGCVLYIGDVTALGKWDFKDADVQNLYAVFE